LLLELHIPSQLVAVEQVVCTMQTLAHIQIIHRAQAQHSLVFRLLVAALVVEHNQLVHLG
jgi:hypothetical protein